MKTYDDHGAVTLACDFPFSQVDEPEPQLIAVPGRPSSIAIEMACECQRQIWEWIYQPPCEDIDGFVCRCIIATWIFNPHLHSYSEAEIARRFGKKKQSLDRWSQDFKRTFPYLKTLQHFRHVTNERPSNHPK